MYHLTIACAIAAAIKLARIAAWLAGIPQALTRIHVLRPSHRPNAFASGIYSFWNQPLKSDKDEQGDRTPLSA